MVSDASRSIDHSGYFICVLVRWFVAGYSVYACIPEMFHFETYEKQWIRTYFLCFYFSISLIWYSLFWYFNIHFLSISFQKRQKNWRRWLQRHAHIFHRNSHFDTWFSFSDLDCKQRCCYGPSSEATYDKEKGRTKLSILRFTFQIILIPDQLTSESPCPSCSLFQFWVIMQLDFWDSI